MGCEEYKELLVTLLYEEATDVEARRIQSHLERCGECRDELATLREVRGALSSWEAPAFERAGSIRAVPTFFWWAAAAAIIMVGLGIGVGVAGMEIRVGREPLIIALGRPVESTALPETSAAKTSTPSSVQPVPVASVPAPRGAGTPDACLLQARELVAASEARQEAVVRASLADLEQRLLAQRQYDMARVSAGLSYLEGKTGQSMARQTELMGQILRVSEGGAR